MSTSSRCEKEIVSIDRVRSGLLVSHRYTPELAVVLRVDWETVEVLLARGAIVKWQMNSFRTLWCDV